MPWYPDLFSPAFLEQIRGQAADARVAAPVPYFAGARTGETQALVESFAGEPELHHPRSEIQTRGSTRARTGATDRSERDLLQATDGGDRGSEQ